ncbi:hypothetical protein BCR35DRAFT_356474 [Leucosporidium creatinivorum]|uniref:DUF6534 domain-containing protein n=1 Tax=Leucosporidium creatinivorum TaxID=106004 RepID=A0A1Y2C2M7_9BASI|nr:hypothetical protein BCR35DRAFT_356474 [Leucosporidium creatinivorum]
MASNAFNNTIGALVVSSAVSCFFMGIVMSEVVTYVRRFPDDKWVFKLLVGVMTLMVVLETGINTSWTWSWACENFANPAGLGIIPWQMKQLPSQSGSVAFVVQMFYTWRIWRIGSGFGGRFAWIIPSIIFVLALTGWATVIWVGHLSFTLTTMDELSKIFPVGYLWFASVIVADILITTTLTYYLIFRTPKFTSTRDAFKQIVFRAVQTNTLSLIFQVQIPPLLLTPTVSGIWFCLPAFLISPIYLYSLVVSLTQRKGMGEGLATGSTPIGNTSDWRPTTAKSSARDKLDVHVSRTQNITVDVESARQPWEEDEIVSPSRKPVAIHFDQQSQNRRGAKDEEHELRNF